MREADVVLKNPTVVDLWARELRYAIRSSRSAETHILSGVDLSVQAGHVTGVLGPNGSGKTTLLKMIIGALQENGGGVFIGEGRGEPAQRLSALPRLKRARMLAMVEQNAEAHVDLTVAEVIALGRLPYQGRFDGVDSGDPVPLQAAQQVGVSHLLPRSFQSLSGGERQRVHLARALAQTPRVLLLDEPANHLDISAQLELLRLVRSVAAGGAGVLITLHDLALAARVCDEVHVLDRGACVASGPPLEVLTPTLIKRVWGVDAEWVRGRAGSALVYA